MRILRSIGAVLVGFVAVFALSVLTDIVLVAAGVFPDPGHPELYSNLQYLLITCYTALYSVAGAWLTARLAPSGPLRHALILGLLGTLASAAGAAAMWSKAVGHEWYPIALIVIAVPSCWFGGILYVRRRRLVR